MASGHVSVEEMKKHVKGYWVIFAALLGLTGVTVGISYIHLPKTAAILLALLVASVKASLVALYFMHLISEKQVIYAVLAITAFMFAVLLAVPWMLY